MNNEGAPDRLALLSRVLARYGLEAKTVTPLEYDESCPFPYNNFTYRVELVTPANSACSPVASKACTTPFPQDGTSTLVFRISNARAEGLVQSNRVQNEVAAMQLARSSAAKVQGAAAPNLIPAIHDWEAAGDDTDKGWMLMQYMPGVALDQHFDDLTQPQKEDIINQVADIFVAIQQADLPESISAYGGLDIGHDGRIISGSMTTLGGGPWSTFVDFLRTKLSTELKEADESEVLQGWHKNGVREQIDRFLESTIAKCIDDAGVDTGKRVLIHSDLTLNNILFDKATNHLTGLVDFDFASVGHPFQEFVDSFRDVGGNVLSAHSPETPW